MTFALPPAMAFTHRLLERAGSRRSDGGVQTELLLRASPALLSPSTLNLFLYSGWKLTAK